MADAFFTIKQGAQNPALEATLTTGAGLPQDLTGGTVTFSMKRKGTDVVKVNAGACTIEGAATLGQVKYAWGALDSDTPGGFYGEFRVTGLAGGPAVFPASGYIWVTVLPRASA